MAYFVEAFRALENMGIRDLLLPFMLIFTLVFAVLQKSQVLGKKSKNFNAIISLVMALVVVIPHITGSYPPGADVVDILNSALPNISLVIVGIIMFFILVGIMGGQPSWVGGKTGGVIALIAIILVVAIFGNSAGWWTNFPWWLRWIQDPDTQAIIIVLVIFGAVIGFVTKDPDSNGGEDSILKGLGDMLKGKGN